MPATRVSLRVTMSTGRSGSSPDDAPSIADLVEAGWPGIEFTEVFRFAPGAMALVDAAKGTILAANQELAARLDLTPEALLGRRWPVPLGGTSQEFRHLASQVRAEGAVVVDQVLGNGCDSVSWRQHVTVVDPADGPPYLIIQVNDRTEEHRHTSELEQLAERDELTGVWNRRRFGREFHRALGTDASHGIGLVLFDVDGFKAVNDAHGHTAGDAALVAIAASLTRNAPEGSLVARLAGDEFAVLVVGATDEETGELCQALSQRTRMVSVDGLPYPVRLSAGWTLAVPGSDPDGRARDAMIEADVAMYAAKARVHAGAPPRPVGTKPLPRSWWTDQPAEETSQLEMWALPVIDLPARRPVQHDVVIQPTGEPTHRDLVGASMLTLHAMVELLDRVGRDSGRHIGAPDSYLVHLPSLPLGLGSAIGWLRRAADDTGLDPGSVTFSLSEAYVAAIGREAVQGLAALGRSGFSIAIDGFGADVGSLRLLVDLPLDQVWLARSVSARLETDSMVRSLINATIGVAGQRGALVGAVVPEHSMDEAHRLGVSLALPAELADPRPLGGIGTA